MIKPHGGKLINNVLSKKKKEKLLKKKEQLVSLSLTEEEIKDVLNIVQGVYSPLTGFLREKDYLSVLEKMKLANGQVWSIPILLAVDNEEKQKLQKNKAKDVLLLDQQENIVAVLRDFEIYQYDKKKHAQAIFGTTSQDHPGVGMVEDMGDFLIGGEVFLVNKPKVRFEEFYYPPAKSREMFQNRGWKSVVAFQTRNVPHRGHEYLQKAALNQVDGVFIQPVIGEKKIQDFKDEYILSCYTTLIENHFPRNSAILGILPLKMRYAGPREAVFHALIRQNFGCSHFIVGRDHAGVKDFYGAYEAQEIFNQFDEDEIEIKILKYPEVIYDQHNHVHTFNYELSENEIVHFSGSKLRKSIEKKEQPPSYLIRPRVYNILVNSKNSLVDRKYKMNQKKKNQEEGMVLWFTGLSQSGKSTLADATCDALREKGVVVERLDGDVVRESLTKDLGFTKEDRNENIRRVGFLAKMLAKNGITVVASFISPYKQARERLKKEIPNFVEIYVNTPLEVCEKRDKKGLYAKARKGEIKNFTGISDPYEAPKNPDIELHPAEDEIEVSLGRVLGYFK